MYICTENATHNNVYSVYIQNIKTFVFKNNNLLNKNNFQTNVIYNTRLKYCLN